MCCLKKNGWVGVKFRLELEEGWVLLGQGRERWHRMYKGHRCALGMHIQILGWVPRKSLLTWMATLEMMFLKGFGESSIFPFCSRVFLSVAGFEQGPFAAVCSNLYASEPLKDSFISIKAEKTPFEAVEWYWWFCHSVKQVPLFFSSQAKDLFQEWSCPT